MQTSPWGWPLLHPPEGPFEPHLNALATSMRNDAYSESTVGRYIRLTAAFSKWLKDNGIGEAEIHVRHAADYLRYRARRRRPTRDDRSILRKAVTLLARRGVVRAPSTHETSNPVVRTLGDYERYLKIERGLSRGTIYHYVRFIRLFLVFRKKATLNVSLSDVLNFVRHQAAQRTSQRATIVTALRSFLSYARYKDFITKDIAAAVPRIAQWTSSTIPKAISQDHARRTLASCDRNTDIGRRDFAILLLLARLGLRAGEIVALKLNDMDWRASVVKVRGKGGQHALLPLPYEVAEAIAEYLKSRRRSNGSRALFTRSIAPIRGLGNSVSVSAIVDRALKRADIPTKRRGAHQFRHALAIQMLRKGASLPEIGQILRHRSIQTTTIYAKADLVALRSLALPWPGRAQ
jgi:integrase/recombinase XerD